MATFNKVYHLHNGYSISQMECYDGYMTQRRWAIWKPSGELYMSCGSYNEAFELAKHLRGEEES